MYYGTSFLFFFFFQAEDGIRDLTVTGVQTCALPIFLGMVLLITSSLLGAINFIATIIQLRAKGLTWMRLPFFVWAQFVTAFLLDRKSTRLNSSHSQISYAVFCLKKKKSTHPRHAPASPPYPRARP